MQHFLNFDMGNLDHTSDAGWKMKVVWKMKQETLTFHWYCRLSAALWQPCKSCDRKTAQVELGTEKAQALRFPPRTFPKATWGHSNCTTLSHSSSHKCFFLVVVFDSFAFFFCSKGSSAITKSAAPHACRNALESSPVGNRQPCLVTTWTNRFISQVYNIKNNMKQNAQCHKQRASLTVSCSNLPMFSMGTMATEEASNS